MAAAPRTPGPGVERAAADRRAPWLALLAAAAGLAVYATALSGGFVPDDRLVLIDARITGRTGIAEIFRTDYWHAVGSAGIADLYRPITTLSFRWNHAVAGPSAAAFHGINVVLHALVSVLVVLLADALFRSRRIALASGLLFALHPVHTEAVTGIVGRAELLAAGFLLAALFLHARSYRLGGYGPRQLLPAALGCFALALLSKESVVVGPALVLLVDATGWLGRGRAPDAGERRHAFAVAGLYAAVVAGFLGLRFAVLGRLGGAPLLEVGLLFGEPFSTRLATALEILAIYLRLLFFPLRLSADYSMRQVPLLDSLGHPMALAGLAAAVALLAALAWAIRRRATPLAFGFGWFAVSYALASNLLTPIGVLVAERLLYLPSLGFCVALAWAWKRLDTRLRGPESRSLRPHPLAAAALGIVLALYGARTWLRNQDWRDALTLFAATVESSPDSAAAHYNYGATLYQQKRDPAGALPHLERALELRPKFLSAHLNTVTAYLELERYDEAREAALRGL
ncbi:MAG TPA: tetratricopeptide repeat protein, partial [Myxococcota bacterium]|nr:tetratricopeptide repeat protein [Myxococcota bacterium]